MGAVVFDHVYKRYKGEPQPAVDDFHLEVGEGEFLVLVGPSGCGKSTTLRMLAGLEEISEGDIYINGRLINYVSPKDRDIAMVFQNYALYPNLSVYDNIALGLKLRKTAKHEIEQKVNGAAKTLEIGHLLHRKPSQLSGGQKQRVALGRAIVRSPQVFLMDEPLSN
ncbi:ABC transporter ATP-binding protein, partial [Paenibacillus sp. 598K]|uniref:ABC transporter ATP-binding protein n=1 Tax=Paenibacillus sp. 598K TaxID=1117987 RepID=UPI000FFE5545